MKKWTIQAIGAAVALTFSPILFAQSDTTPAPRPDGGRMGSPATDMTPSRTGMGMGRTPAASTTPGYATTPGYGSNGSTGSSATSGSGSSAMSATGQTGSGSMGGGGGRPMTRTDCANDAWRGYSKPKFTSQKRCESWVRTHGRKSGGSHKGAMGATESPDTTGTMGTTGGTTGTSTTGSTRSTTPGSDKGSTRSRRTTPGASTTPSSMTTPGASR